MSDRMSGAGSASTASGELAAVLSALDAHLGRDWSEAGAAQVHAELVALEQAQRRLRATQARVMAEARRTGAARQMGYINERQMLTGGLGLAPGEARGRLEDSSIADTARMAATAAGRISAGHLKIINTTLAALPDEVDDDERNRLETELIALAAERATTRRLQENAHRLLDQIDPGRTERGAAERARRRSVTCSGQGLDLMARASMTMDPQLAALMREVHARWAQPGRLWPDEQTPDERSDGQRMHDALVHALTLALNTDARKTGAAAAIVVRIDLDQLATLAGCGQTDSGIRVPVDQAIAMAAGNHWFLALCDQEIDLKLYRSRRTASRYQRLALFAAYGGCTHPDCDQDARHCQAHHAGKPWAAGGQTNIDELALTSADCHSMIHDTGWTTIPDRTAPQGVRWIPPTTTPRATNPPPPKPGPPPLTPLHAPVLPFALLHDLDHTIAQHTANSKAAA
ncbi:HNH endonuclease signature motif containing protein [Dietzia cinnamea]|uniref:HNH endonuclease n=3 Tax=Dietzia TaxID=37914 RepID=A0AAW5Q318_9ACTN|nr:HNH endonuclease signature motif containing protein [Dietzia cinnamea]MCT1640741.1 HNH endonuclease [Dietzia cinnamea]MCT1863286.1 HNH endonuclease [Dietzia cinnamea]MCT1885151.1 HNH endonuclease [Dietzia cinnamea]MCT2029615.1 HNH endonuclease [Dietzia cinnamea]MCT2031974.1 HNH endonuclease [Dietzia cinnamea]